MSERDPMDTLRDLIDEPVAPRAAFADELRSRLMREMAASDSSREEQNASMNAVFAPRPPVAFPTESVRRIRPMVILELAAVAVVILGLVAALNRGWFQSDPEPPTAVPAAILQDDSTPTPANEPEQTPTPTANTLEPTVVPDTASEQTPTPVPMGSMEPTVVPPGNIPNTVWALPWTEGESIDFGGLLVDDDTVYRLLATSSFVGVQAVDAETGTVKWQQAHRWAGNLFAIEDDVLYFDGGGNTLTAVDTDSGAERWRVPVEGNPIALADGDDDSDAVYVLLDTDFVTALNVQDGQQRWVAQGTVPQNPTGGSASSPATGKIAVAGDTVAAISTFGVLSGFDAATGTERWSREGYDAALVTILAEDDVLVISEGFGGFGAGVGVMTGGSPAPGNVESGAVSSEAAPGSAAGNACSTHFATGNDVAPAANGAGTPEAGIQTTTEASFRVQGVDPSTGDVLWEQQAAAGGVSTAGQGVEAPGSDMVVCSVDTEQGTVSGAAIAGSAASGAIEFDDDDNLVAIGVVSGDGFTPVDPVTGGEGGSAALLTLPDGVGSAQVIAVASDDGETFLQLVDGTLVKVDAGDPPPDDHEDRDDGSPESETDDD